MDVAFPTTNATHAADDRDLVALCRQGDRIAFDRLIRRYQSMIVSLCVRLMGDREEGIDAAQDAFVKAYRHIGGFKGDARFSTWLYQIAVNTCRNKRSCWWRRLMSRAVRLDQPRDTRDEKSAPCELADTRMTPLKDLQRHRRTAMLRQALAALAPRQRELIVLRDLDGLSYEEIGIVAGISSIGTVKSRIARARNELRRRLKGHGNEIT